MAPWHRGFHEGVDWLSAVPHAPRREPGSISGEKVSVSSTDVPEYPREDNGEVLPSDTRPLGNWASCRKRCLDVFEDSRRLVDCYAWSGYVAQYQKVGTRLRTRSFLESLTMVEFDDVIVVFRIRSRTTTRSRPRRVSERVGSPSQLFLLALSDANLNIIVLQSVPEPMLKASYAGK